MQTFLTALQKTIKKQSYILVFINILDSHLINYDNVCVTKLFWGHFSKTCFWGHLESLLGQSVYHSEHSSFEASDGHCSHVHLEGILRETYYWVVEKLSGGERGEKLGVGPRLSVRTSVLARSATWVRRAWSVRDRVRVGTCCILARGGAKLGSCSYVFAI